MLAPANEASIVNTNGILNLWNIVILAVDSFEGGIEYVQSSNLKKSSYFESNKGKVYGVWYTCGFKS